ncbi:hypothetical protein [Micromonospora sp. WMMD1082]|uniref:hypothetical protein n=1 Tax=Micromonospora sp. WMMD1082 TaxID=3016104 RepID=UPI0024166E0B|nr:hypothetical protein [Micromonospora sp. WMMD1082]MDG4795018.1 hypothetical protein [Micromonospora sp. WMMD1082]
MNSSREWWKLVEGAHGADMIHAHANASGQVDADISRQQTPPAREQGLDVTTLRREHRDAAIAKVLRRKIKAAVDPTTATIAEHVYDLNEIAARLAATADYDGLTQLIATDLAPTRIASRTERPAPRRGRLRPTRTRSDGDGGPASLLEQESSPSPAARGRAPSDPADLTVPQDRPSTVDTRHWPGPRPATDQSAEPRREDPTVPRPHPQRPRQGVWI